MSDKLVIDENATDEKPVDAATIYSAFERAPIYLQFQCSHSVYAKGVETSICYTTTEERGDLIVEALNHFKATGKLDEWVSKRNVKVEARHDEA